MDRDGLPVAAEDAPKPNQVLPMASLENPQDTGAFARAKCRFPFEVLFALLSTVLTCFVLGTHWELYVRLGELVTQADALNFTASSHSIVLAEYALNQVEFADTICDAEYFEQYGFQPIQANLVGLRDACLAFFILSLLPHYCFLIYRAGHLRELYYQRSRSAYSIWKPEIDPNTGQLTQHGNDPTGRVNVGSRNDPTGRVNVGDLSVPGQIRRSERVALRGETSGYFAVQLLHEIPLVLIFFLFIAFNERYKGLECAQCFAEDTSCYVPSYFSTSMLLTSDSALRWCMGATFFSVAWTYLTLCFRWLHYISTLVPRWPLGKRFMAWLLSTLVMLSNFGLPIAILFTVYVGPVYYGFQDVTTAIGLSAAGGVLVLGGLMVFLGCAGLAVGESMFEALICCNFFTVCFWVCPCVDCSDDVVTTSGIFCPMFCPCCWC